MGALGTYGPTMPKVNPKILIWARETAGLSPEEAQRLLVQAFIGDAFVALEDEEEREKLIAVALQKLEGRV